MYLHVYIMHYLHVVRVALVVVVAAAALNCKVGRMFFNIYFI